MFFSLGFLSTGDVTPAPFFRWSLHHYPSAWTSGYRSDSPYKHVTDLLWPGLYALIVKYIRRYSLCYPFIFFVWLCLPVLYVLCSTGASLWFWGARSAPVWPSLLSGFIGCLRCCIGRFLGRAGCVLHSSTCSRLQAPNKTSICQVHPRLSRLSNTEARGKSHLV